LVFSGSTRGGSLNTQLAALVAKRLVQADAEVTRISLVDYALPLYDGDLEARDGVPAAAIKLEALLRAHHGVFIAAPEYNAGITPLLKNALDWISRVRPAGAPPRAAFRDRIFAVSSAAPGVYGGMRGLLMLRQVLEIGLGATVIPEQVAVGNAATAFDARGDLADDRAEALLAALVDRLVGEAKRYTA